MLANSEDWVQTIELWTITDVLSGVRETTGSENVVANNGHLALGRLDLASDHFEHGCLPSAGHSKQCKALTVLKAKRDALNSFNLFEIAFVECSVVLLCTKNSYWILLW